MISAHPTTWTTRQWLALVSALVLIIVLLRGLAETWPGRATLSHFRSESYLDLRE